MGEKAKKTFGWICIVYACVLLIGNVAMTFVPELEAMAKKTPRDHLLSLSLILIAGGIGLSLVRNRENMLWRILIFCLLLSPLFILRAGQEMGTNGQGSLYPWGKMVFVGLSTIGVAAPYIAGNRILKGLQAKKKPHVMVPPNQILLLIGFACALVPSNVGFYLMVSGQGRDQGEYFVGTSYVAVLSWWLWWRRRYKLNQSNGTST